MSLHYCQFNGARSNTVSLVIHYCVRVFLQRIRQWVLLPGFDYFANKVSLQSTLYFSTECFQPINRLHQSTVKVHQLVTTKTADTKGKMYQLQKYVDGKEESELDKA